MVKKPAPFARSRTVKEGKCRVEAIDRRGERVRLSFEKPFFASLEKALTASAVDRPTVHALLNRAPLLENALVQRRPREFFDLLRPLRCRLLHLFAARPVENHLLAEYVETWDEESVAPKRLEFIVYFDETDSPFLVDRSQRLKKCDHCGATYQSKHTCNVRAASYFNRIVQKGNRPYKFIPFAPVTSPPAKSLYLTYDLETFTKHTEVGKQLLPFVLAFALDGDEKLVRLAQNTALELGYRQDPESRNFYHVDASHVELIRTFTDLRLKLHGAVLSHYWQEILRLYRLPAENLAVDQILDRRRVAAAVRQSLSPDESQQPLYYEVTVVGHNVSSFDEIIVWPHLVEFKKLRAEFPQFTWTNTFMPRSGKLLFNDMLASLPNPRYAHRYDQISEETVRRWRNGEEDAARDWKWQGVTFRVRDTYLLTHASLANAAKAYGLPVDKGDCPYEAVNDLLKIGTYRKEEKKFPQSDYWKNPERYRYNKDLTRSNEKDYDLIKETVRYCLRDVTVTAALVQKLYQAYQTFYLENIAQPRYHRFDVFKRPTVSSNTHALFKQTLYALRGSDKKLPGLVAPTGEGYAVVRNSIRGGRCYPTYLGLLQTPIYVYDVCGMYASALTHPLPYGLPLELDETVTYLRHLQRRLSQPRPLGYFDEDLKPAIVRADCFPPPSENLHTLPPMSVKSPDGGLIWTNEPLIDQTVTVIDLVTLKKSGWSCYVKPENAIVWPKWECVCAPYVRINIRAKEKASLEKNETLRSISKLLSNALYGSFATRLDGKKTIVGEPDVEDVGKYRISNITYLNSDTFPSIVTNLREYDEESENARLTDPPTTECKNIVFVDADEEDLIIYTAESKEEDVVNDRYPTQLASFVLAWTRAFTAEWADFLFAEDLGKPIEDRTLKNVYGDTDSIFLTEEGRRLLMQNGAHRIKGHPDAKLVFDPLRPTLAWAVECETVCPVCGKDAYAPESIYIAPKIYALSRLHCPECGPVGKETVEKGSKVKAKGHEKNQVTFDSLVKCYLWYLNQKTREEKRAPSKEETTFQTERASIKKTLLIGDKRNAPMTVREKILSRILKPWNEPKMREETDQKKNARYGKGKLMYPFDEAHPCDPKKLTMEVV